MTGSPDPLLEARIILPEHVVRREFPNETIALNLDSGQYHGLNATAAKMIDAFERGLTPAEVAAWIAKEASRPREVVEADVLALVRTLADRALIEIHAVGAG